MNNITRDKLKTILYEAFKDSWELGGGSQFRFKHGVEVAEFSLKIASGEKIELDVDSLYLAGLFHDIGKVKAITKTGEIDYESEANKNHENITPEFLREFVGELVSEQSISKAVEIIQEPVSAKCSTERKVLKDADELGNFGFSQVWRTLNFIALSHQSFDQMLAFWKSGNLTEREKWIDQLFFEISKRTAKKRYKKFVSFLEQIENESLGKDIE